MSTNKTKSLTLTTATPNVPPRPTNNLVTPLLTDLYQITMAYAYWKSKKHEDHAVFEVFFRKNPFKGTYTLFCGIDEVLPFLHHYKFTQSDIDYLKQTPSLRHCEPEFFDYLAQVDTSEVKVQSLQQGTMVFPREPLLIVSGPILVCQLLETTILNLINFPSLIATNASRLVIAARGQHGDKHQINGKSPLCVEYGLRRAQGPDGGLSASKYCMVGGFDGTANVLAGKLYGLPVLGTHAHAFVQSYNTLEEVEDLILEINNQENKVIETKVVNVHDQVLLKREELVKKLGPEYNNTNEGELAAFIAYAVAFPNGFLSLVDTYHTMKSGIKNFLLVALVLNDCGYAPRGIRIDSGDLASTSKEIYALFQEVATKLNQPFLKQLIIIVSDGINEKKLHTFNKKQHKISAYGIGTNLVTCEAQPALGCVFKLVGVNGEPRIKFSDDPRKTLIPGLKRSFRFFDADGVPRMDVLIRSDEPVPKSGKEFVCYNMMSFQEGDEELPPTVKITPYEVKELLHVVWGKTDGVGGNTATDSTNRSTMEVLDLMKARDYALEQIKSIDPDMLRRKDPKEYNVYISRGLFEDLDKLVKKNELLKEETPFNSKSVKKKKRKMLKFLFGS